MTVYSQKLQNDAGDWPAYRDNVSVIRTITGLDSGQTISKGWLTVKTNLTDDDVDAVLQLEITTSLTNDGQVTDDGTAATSGELTFTITEGDGDYSGISPDVNYYYDIQTLLGDGTLSTLERGRVRWEQDVTAATS